MNWAYIVKINFFVAHAKTTGLPYAHDISKILALTNVELIGEFNMRMKESESLIDKSVLRKMGVF